MSNKLRPMFQRPNVELRQVSIVAKALFLHEFRQKLTEILIVFAFKYYFDN